MKRNLSPYILNNQRNHWRKRVSLLAGLALLATTTFQSVANQFELQFTATGFSAGSPTDPVSGAILFQATDIHGTILSVDAIDLTIAGHTYTSEEIGWLQGTSSTFMGGTLNGVHSLYWPTDDFFLSWDHLSLGAPYLEYTTSSLPGLFTSHDALWPVFAISEVPEPGVGALVFCAAAVTLSRSRSRW